MLSKFMVCRASGLWAYADGRVHPEFSLTCTCLTLPLSEPQAAFWSTAIANFVQVPFVTSNTDLREVGVDEHPDVGSKLAGAGRSSGGNIRSAAGYSRQSSATCAGGVYLTIKLTLRGWKSSSRTGKSGSTSETDGREERSEVGTVQFY